MYAMNSPASEFAIYKTMQSIDCCYLATEEYEITSCVHAEYNVAMETPYKI